MRVIKKMPHCTGKFDSAVYHHRVGTGLAARELSTVHMLPVWILSPNLPVGVMLFIQLVKFLH